MTDDQQGLSPKMNHRCRCPCPQFLLFILCFMTCSYQKVHAFVVSNPLQRTQPSLPSSSSSSLSMCICINCKYVTSCKAYHFVETKHEQPHMTETPTFEPRDGSPTIHVNVRTIRNKEEQQQEAQRMWKEHEAETKRAQELQPGATGEGDLVGEAVYDFAPVTTYEYDVVKCADFVEDKGAWVRNMPEAIRLANPNFVPS